VGGEAESTLPRRGFMDIILTFYTLSIGLFRLRLYQIIGISSKVT